MGIKGLWRGLKKFFRNFIEKEISCVISCPKIKFLAGGSSDSGVITRGEFKIEHRTCDLCFIVYNLYNLQFLFYKKILIKFLPVCYFKMGF